MKFLKLVILILLVHGIASAQNKIQVKCYNEPNTSKCLCGQNEIQDHLDKLEQEGIKVNILFNPAEGNYSKYSVEVEDSNNPGSYVSKEYVKVNGDEIWFEECSTDLLLIVERGNFMFVCSDANLWQKISEFNNTIASSHYFNQTMELNDFNYKLIEDILDIVKNHFGKTYSHTRSDCLSPSSVTDLLSYIYIGATDSPENYADRCLLENSKIPNKLYAGLGFKPIIMAYSNIIQESCSRDFNITQLNEQVISDIDLPDNTTYGYVNAQSADNQQDKTKYFHHSGSSNDYVSPIRYMGNEKIEAIEKGFEKDVLQADYPILNGIQFYEYMSLYGMSDNSMQTSESDGYIANSSIGQGVYSFDVHESDAVLLFDYTPFITGGNSVDTALTNYGNGNIDLANNPSIRASVEAFQNKLQSYNLTGRKRIVYYFSSKESANLTNYNDLVTRFNNFDFNDTQNQDVIAVFHFHVDKTNNSAVVNEKFYRQLKPAEIEMKEHYLEVGRSGREVGQDTLGGKIGIVNCNIMKGIGAITLLCRDIYKNNGEIPPEYYISNQADLDKIKPNAKIRDLHISPVIAGVLMAVKEQVDVLEIFFMVKAVIKGEVNIWEIVKGFFNIKAHVETLYPCINPDNCKTPEQTVFSLTKAATELVINIIMPAGIVKRMLKSTVGKIPIAKKFKDKAQFMKGYVNGISESAKAKFKTFAKNWTDKQYKAFMDGHSKLYGPQSKKALDYDVYLKFSELLCNKDIADKFIELQLKTGKESNIINLPNSEYLIDISNCAGRLVSIKPDNLKNLSKKQKSALLEDLGKSKKGGPIEGLTKGEKLETYFITTESKNSLVVKRLENYNSLIDYPNLRLDVDNLELIDKLRKTPKYKDKSIAEISAELDQLVQGSTPKKGFAKLCINGLGCFVEDTPVLMAHNNYKVNFGNTVKAMAVAASMPIVAVPIQDVQLLDYAVAHETVNATYGMTASTDDDIYLGLTEDPYTSDQQRERDEYQLDDENWNEVVFEEVHGGSTAKLALHNDWIEKQSYEIDAVVNLNLPEQGISGPFRITSIKHIIPQKKPVDDDEADEYDYRPVTALFTHESNQVFNISFDNGEELGVTYQHPIYSTTAGDWKLAGELEIGEEVLTKSGNTKVVSSTKKEGSETVYNLEVKELHNFLVGESGVVVHNNCLTNFMKLFFGKFTRKKVPGKKWVDYAEESGLAKHVDDLKEFDQLERLGENMQKRMTHLHLDKNGHPFPGIDGFIEDGAKAIPVSLKQVTSSKVKRLGDNIKDIAIKAKNANATADFDGVLKDITGMVTAKKFTKQQIIDKIQSVRQLHPIDSKIVKKYFVEGKDGSGWIEF